MKFRAGIRPVPRVATTSSLCARSSIVLTAANKRPMMSCISSTWHAMRLPAIRGRNPSSRRLAEYQFGVLVARQEQTLWILGSLA